MKCFFCDGTLENGVTTHVTDIGTRAAEVSYDGAVYKKLEAMVNAHRNSLTELEIVNFNEKNAA
ncbi:MAG: hypothetical protein FWC16_00510 [Defluviitaleaceae bacterium]|nr:hypothetical protein [Defluviitaleaceae bacterium]MCL2273385.1 hypothetical protein [Defluviitaleaceae bacterium]